MFAAFATPYTIHFDDTMAYGSHHFLTGFKFQCQARESLLYGDLIFDRADVPAALNAVHLFTADAYNRNLNPAYLGDRLVIFLTLEDWGNVSARFCYRVLNQRGQPIAAGFQNHVCADPQTGQPRPLPEPLRQAFDEIRQISEQLAKPSFRELSLAGGEKTRGLFSREIQQAAERYLAVRHPVAGLVEILSDGRGDKATSSHVQQGTAGDNRATSPEIKRIDSAPDLSVSHASSIQPARDHRPPSSARHSEDVQDKEVWFFPGQGTFDAQFLSFLLERHRALDANWGERMAACPQLLTPYLDGDLSGFFSGNSGRCLAAAEKIPSLSQVGIFLQGVLTGEQRLRTRQPGILVGHSLGEIAALTVAGSLDFSAALIAVAQRTNHVISCGAKDGGLLAVFASRSQVSEELDVLETTQVVIAGRNHETQTLLSGPCRQLAVVRAHLERMGLRSVEIASPAAFHHPSLFPAAQAWRADLQRLCFRQPKFTVYSIIGRRAVAIDADLPGLLSAQLMRPFDLQGVIDDLALAGFRHLVDCGSTGSLQRLLTAASPGFMNCVRGHDFAGNVPGQAGRIGDRPLPPAANAPPPARAMKLASKPTILITGQGCVLPGGASSPAALSELLRRKRSGIEDLRTGDSWWESDFFSAELQPDRATSGLSGKVLDSDLIAPVELDADWFDDLTRAQKIFALAVQQCRPALADAAEILCLVGATADGFEDQDRVAALRYAGLDPQSPQVAEYRVEKPGALVSPFEALDVVLKKLLPAKYKLRLLDAACASSLYAVAQGMTALENRRADVVLVGGIYCPGPGNNCLFSQFKGLTDSECRPFDAQASGVVFAEGAALLVIRRAEDLGQSHTPPLAVVRGVGLSSDGRSPSANVPKSEGQILALQRCYENYDIDPASISAIEGHGTATPTGDATEVRTLAKFFSPHVSAPIPLHSMKGLIGHTGWAAGTAAILLAVQAISRRLLPGQANLTQPSAAVRDAEDVLTVSADAVDLPKRPLRIAVDGFGFGGANAHVVIEEWVSGEMSAMTSSAENGCDDPGQPRGAGVSLSEELVVVAETQISAAELLNGCPLPAGMVVLPDLADEMDVTQSIAVALTNGLIQQLPQYDEADRRETSVVMALAGKSQRACEATLRILGPRLARDLPAETAVKLLTGYAEARPSGPYTLQGMMPNVATGRAALLLNLNGPNFVIDAGADSQQALWEAAECLLQSGSKSGTRMVVVGQLPSFSALSTIGNRQARGGGAGASRAALITLRSVAVEKGWPIIKQGNREATELPSQEVDPSRQDGWPGQQAFTWVETPVPRQAAGSPLANPSSRTPVVMVISSQQLATRSSELYRVMRTAALVVVVGKRAEEPELDPTLPWIAFDSTHRSAAANLALRLGGLQAIELLTLQELSEDSSVVCRYYEQVAAVVEVAAQAVSGGIRGIWNLLTHATPGKETLALQQLQSLYDECSRRKTPVRTLLSSRSACEMVFLQWQNERRLKPEFVVWYRGSNRLVGRSQVESGPQIWGIPEIPKLRSESSSRICEIPVQLDYWEIADFHQARNVPTIPGAWIIDQMVRGVLLMANARVRQIEIKNVQFLKFAKVPRGSDLAYRILIAGNTGGYQAWMLGNITNPQGEILKGNEVFAVADLRPIADKLPRRKLRSGPSVRPNDQGVVDPYCNRAETIQLSGPFDCLRQIEIGEVGRRARFQPKVDRVWFDTVPAMAIDAAIRVAGMHAAESGLHVPTKIERMVLPVGRGSCSLEDADWQIVADRPRCEGDNIFCGNVDVVDGVGQVQATIQGAVVARLK